MTVDTATRDELEALLRWYVDMGVDLAVDAEPHDRFAEAAALREAKIRRRCCERGRVRSSSRTGARDAAARSPGLHRGTGAARPVGCGALGRCRDAFGPRGRGCGRHPRRAAGRPRGFDGCSLKGTATQLVFADGNPEGRVMVVGEAPGADEDRQGKPFVGRSGQLFDRMLAAIGLDRSHVYIANIVPWRPPGNRTPTPQEVAICMPFIARQIALADPDFLVCLGGSATQGLLGSKEGILRLRGRWHDFETGRRSIKAMPMLHPAYLLRQPAHKKLAWADLRALRKALDAL